MDNKINDVKITYYQANKKKRLEYQRKWYESNRAIISEYNRQYYYKKKMCCKQQISTQKFKEVRSGIVDRIVVYFD